METTYGKFSMTAYKVDGEVLTSGTIILQKGIKGLQEKLRSNSKIWYCELIANNGEMYRVTGESISPMNRRTMLKKIARKLRFAPQNN